MIDFRCLNFAINDTYSFVGIEKRQGLICFCLPRGFIDEINKINDFNKSRDLFFLFYRIFKTFKKICIDKGYLNKVNELGKNDRDGVINSNHGSDIQDDGDDSENVFYSKLDIIGSLLDAYDEPKILSLASRLGKSDRFDVSQIHKYLHHAIYLPNNAAYVDQALLPRKVVQFESTDIITMYCYLFCEVKQQLKENIKPEIESLAERFKEKYLRYGDSIFDEESYEQVLDILKDTLEKIDHHTPIKDADYWQYYEAIELFLYGDLSKEEDGEIWGISNFHNVWESMCLSYLAKNTEPSLLLHLDTRYIKDSILKRFVFSQKIIDLSNTFTINNKKLMPDAVIFSSVLDENQITNYNYKVHNNSWTDFSYKTCIKGFSIRAKIAYIGQQKDVHTINKLQQFYPPENHPTIPNQITLKITKPLPKIFYSFWTIPEDISIYDIRKMHCFNHFFCLALEHNLTNWDSFFNRILQPLNINFDLSLTHNDISSNAFTHSLFRDSITNSTFSFKYIEEEFNRFIKQALELSKIEVIDIKYFTEDYFMDSTNTKEIKNRSVRKQFVYEYLIQQKLEQREDEFNNLNIHSSFWIPVQRPYSPNLIFNDPFKRFSDENDFMDDYIKLEKVNFSVLAENYIA